MTVCYSSNPLLLTSVGNAKVRLMKRCELARALSSRAVPDVAALTPYVAHVPIPLICYGTLFCCEAARYKAEW
jgi:hypothetical protein